MTIAPMASTPARASSTGLFPLGAFGGFDDERRFRRDMHPPSTVVDSMPGVQDAPSEREASFADRTMMDSLAQTQAATSGPGKTGGIATERRGYDPNS